MPSENELRINAALEGRRGQRERVAELAAIWAELTQEFDALITAIRDAAKTSYDLSPNGDSLAQIVAAAAGLERLIGDHTGLSEALADVERRINSLRHRVNRDTVNIGVLGRTRAGKSTLLRGVTNLDKDVIPSSDWDSTTAAASRIYHHPTDAAAVVYFHTWDSFRKSYLVPLHAAAGLGPAPNSPAEFAQYEYPAVLDSRERADRQRFINRLLVAQRSFPSYSGLLTGTDRPVPLPELRPYISYPTDDDPDQLNRPYHAVSGVVIRHPFRHLEVAKLGLIDLPGSGEAGLDVDQQFLRRLRDELDLLLVVKRTVADETFWSDADWDSIGLADSVRGGVSLADFVCIVVNQDETQLSPEGLTRTTEKMRAEAGKRGIMVLTPNAMRPDTIQTELMAPVLRHLARQLAEMDRAAIRDVRVAAQEVAAGIAELATAVTGHLSGWRAAMPNEQAELRERARKLRFAIAAALAAITDRYEKAAATGDGTEPAFRAAISSAVGAANAWVDSGLGAGSQQQWLDKIEGPGGIIAEGAALRERQYAIARTRVDEFFSQVDTSVDSAIRGLFAEIATALRTQLTEEIVPEGEDALEQLVAISQSRQGSVLPAALTELANLRSAYGKTLLRVTRPIIRTIREDAGRAPVTGTDNPTAGDDAAAVERLRRAGSAYLRAQTGPIVEAAADLLRDAPRSGTGNGRVGDASQAAQALYDNLTSLVRQRVRDLEKALLAEGRVMSTVLAAATDRFLDQAVQTPDVHFEYLDLCAPIQRTLWPDIFDGGPAQFGAALAAVESAASSLLSAAGPIRRLDE
jgi:hypothetical protein